MLYEVITGFSEKDGEVPYTAITAFEVLEHVHAPLTFLEQSLSKYGTRTVIFSTELYEGVPPRPEDWWYYALKTGQHISFYRLGTLKFLANSLGLHLQSHGGIHIRITSYNVCYTKLLRTYPERVPDKRPVTTRKIPGKQGMSVIM